MILVVEIVEESEVGSKEDRDSGQLGSTKGSCPKRGRRVIFTPAPASRGRASADAPGTRNYARVDCPVVVIILGQVALGSAWISVIVKRQLTEERERPILVLRLPQLPCRRPLETRKAVGPRVVGKITRPSARR